jgi:hypothetical protein
MARKLARELGRENNVADNMFDTEVKLFEFLQTRRSLLCTAGELVRALNKLWSDHNCPRVTLQIWKYKFIANSLRTFIHRFLGGPFGLAKATPDNPALFGVPTRLGSLF